MACTSFLTAIGLMTDDPLGCVKQVFCKIVGFCGIPFIRIHTQRIQACTGFYQDRFCACLSPGEHIAPPVADYKAFGQIQLIFLCCPEKHIGARLTA